MTIIFKHGEYAGGTRTPEYTAWVMMKQRCLNPKCWAYKDASQSTNKGRARLEALVGSLTDDGEMPSAPTLSPGTIAALVGDDE